MWILQRDDEGLHGRVWDAQPEQAAAARAWGQCQCDGNGDCNSCCNYADTVRSKAASMSWMLRDKSFILLWRWTHIEPAR